jgi:hypothetical protein
MERFLLLTYQKQTKKIELPEEAGFVNLPLNCLFSSTLSVADPRQGWLLGMNPLPPFVR